MAAVIPFIPEVEAAFASIFGTGVVAGIAKVALGALAGFAATDLIKYLEGHPAAKTKTPQYAIVDLHNNKTVAFLSRKRVYRFLLRPRRRVPSTKHTEIIREVPYVTRER